MKSKIKMKRKSKIKSTVNDLDSRGVGRGVGYTPLLECDVPGTGKRTAMKKKII